MKVLVHDYAGHPFQLQLSKELNARGYKVCHSIANGILTPQGDIEDAERCGIKVERIGIGDTYRARKYNLFHRRRLELRYGEQLAKVILSLMPDIVLCANTPTEPQESARIAASRCGAKFIPWVQDSYALAVERLLSKKSVVLGRIVGKYYRSVERKTLAKSPHIILICNEFKGLLKEYNISERNGTVIENWAPIDQIPVREKVNSWSMSCGIAESFNFLYSGTLALKHNPDLIMQLREQITDPRVNIIVVSEGPGVEYIKRRQQSSRAPAIRTFPFQDFKVMSEVLASADVLVSVLEKDAAEFSVPSKILSYFCAQRAQLAAVPERNLAAKLILRANAGIVVEPDSAEKWCFAARGLLENPVSRSVLGRNGRAYAESAFRISEIADRFELVFRQAGSLKARGHGW